MNQIAAPNGNVHTHDNKTEVLAGSASCQFTFNVSVSSKRQAVRNGCMCMDLFWMLPKGILSIYIYLPSIQYPR